MPSHGGTSRQIPLRNRTHYQLENLLWAGLRSTGVGRSFFFDVFTAIARLFSLGKLLLQHFIQIGKANAFGNNFLVGVE